MESSWTPPTTSRLTRVDNDNNLSSRRWRMRGLKAVNVQVEATPFLPLNIRKHSNDLRLALVGNLVIQCRSYSSSCHLAEPLTSHHSESILHLPPLTFPNQSSSPALLITFYTNSYWYGVMTAGTMTGTPPLLFFLPVGTDTNCSRNMKLPGQFQEIWILIRPLDRTSGSCVSAMSTCGPDQKLVVAPSCLFTFFGCLWHSPLLANHIDSHLISPSSWTRFSKPANWAQHPLGEGKCRNVK